MSHWAGGGPTRLRSRWISNRGLASLVGTIMAWDCPLPVTVCASFGRDRAMAIKTPASTCSDRHADARTENAPDRGGLDMNYNREGDCKSKERQQQGTIFNKLCKRKDTSDEVHNTAFTKCKFTVAQQHSCESNNMQIYSSRTTQLRE
ncbi:hypothetical protein AVEN_154862-1 [Araneus ventricosus]|uniref:Uncharacterized protein n=1 Tax=Araneus ventricosus TaxID=182803 RepID=A0A4Y2V750_ARAVE|nr:hypothetical protein AVEN_154862-1 [Araneus ventricosus]